jgi:uncharacterized membrane protein
MKTIDLALASAAAAAFSLALAGAAQAQSGPAAKPSFKAEKCYGVVKAGKNDCQTASSSCAGTSKRDDQADAWVYLPEGLCGKLAGGVAKS